MTERIVPEQNQPSYLDFTREEWAKLHASTPLTLTPADLSTLQGSDEAISPREIVEIYLPILRLINLLILATRQRRETLVTFLGRPLPAAPFVLGVTGSVAVGKSATSLILQALLSRWLDHPRVDLVSTDGFLFSNAILEQRGILYRKGFPESYDTRRLVHFLADLKSGSPVVSAPVYSHLFYDIMPEQFQTVERADIVILEGVNVLQNGGGSSEEGSQIPVSDYLDFSIYVDAAEEDIYRWFLQRFFHLRERAVQDSASFYHQFAQMPEEEARQIAEQAWQEINAVNLREHIAPTRERADLILHKAADHSVQRIWLRKR